MVLFILYSLFNELYLVFPQNLFCDFSIDYVIAILKLDKKFNNLKID